MVSAGDWIELTRPLNAVTPIYTEGDYRDPPLSVETWTTIEAQGYWVSRVQLGTQTGTHIDAPAHFDPGGATVDALPATALIGRYALLRVGARVLSADLDAFLAGYAAEPILFLIATAGTTAFTPAALDALLALPPRLWVLDGGATVVDEAPLAFHQRLAGRGKFLVEDLAPGATAPLETGGDLIALPLALEGVSGAPCRVLVRPHPAASS